MISTPIISGGSHTLNAENDGVGVLHMLTTDPLYPVTCIRRHSRRHGLRNQIMAAAKLSNFLNADNSPSLADQENSRKWKQQMI